MSGSRLIVALDFATAAEAQAFVARVTPSQCRLKVGLELFTAAGPALVSELAGRGFDVFLDLKYHDIPNTVARACARVANLGVWMLNVHTLGGRRMLEAAREAVDQATHRPLLIGVTVLTSHEENDMVDLGLSRDIGAQVERLAQLAQNCRLDGVVCSPWEVERLRQRCGKNFSWSPPASARRMHRRTTNTAPSRRAKPSCVARIIWSSVGR